MTRLTRFFVSLITFRGAGEVAASVSALLAPIIPMLSFGESGLIFATIYAVVVSVLLFDISVEAELVEETVLELLSERAGFKNRKKLRDLIGKEGRAAAMKVFEPRIRISRLEKELDEVSTLCEVGGIDEDTASSLRRKRASISTEIAALRASLERELDLLSKVVAQNYASLLTSEGFKAAAAA